MNRIAPRPAATRRQRLAPDTTGHADAVDPAGVEIVPSAAALILSLRGLGYSAETAIADLIDNSIAAEATSVDIDVAWNAGDPTLRVVDDGTGLNDAGLVDALRFGGAGPLAGRSESDLGRFGLGLKTASLSQCRRMTVASKQGSAVAALSWDVDEVEARDRWQATRPTDQRLLTDCLAERPSGTVVLWERMDAMGGLSGLDREAFFLRIQEIRSHLEMVFHRFLGGDARRLSISVNGRSLRAWDPFLVANAATITLQTERLRHRGAILTIVPYVLPHRDRFANDEEYEAAGGSGGWGERQGFYVYRGKRLVVAGGWLGLGGTRAWTREESSRLARIAVDLPARLDADWRIDVRKSVARPPAVLRPRLAALGHACRQRAREVFAWRGSRGRSASRIPGQEPIWTANGGQGRANYRIRRDHPGIQAISAILGPASPALDGLLALIERSVPVERIWLDVSESGGATQVLPQGADLSELAGQLAALVKGMRDTRTFADRLDALLRQLPLDGPELRRAVLQELGPQA